MLPIVAFLLLFASPAHDGVHERLAANEARIAQRPFDAGLRVERANLLREHAEFARALDDLETATRLDPCATGLDCERGQCLLALGRDAQAENAFDRALESDPKDCAAYRARAQSRERQGELAAALEDRRAVLRWAICAEPEFFLELAAAQVAVGALEDALGTLDRGVERLGLAPALVLRAIELEERLQDVDGALSRLEKWARTLPRKESGWVLRGEILERARRADEARGAWTRALVAIDGLPPAQRSSQATRELVERARSGLARLEHRARSSRALAGGSP